MTEAGREWAVDLATKMMSDDYDQAHALSSRAAEFWLSAFCDEVKKRAALKTHSYSPPEYQTTWTICRSEAFDELKHELLGDKP